MIELRGEQRSHRLFNRLFCKNFVGAQGLRPKPAPKTCAQSLIYDQKILSIINS